VKHWSSALLGVLVACASPLAKQNASFVPCPTGQPTAKVLPSAAACVEPRASAVPASSAPPPAADPAPRVIELWPEGVPGLLSDAPPERIEDERVYNVSVATLTVFPARTPDERRAAVIVCPGGAYVRLAVAKEGSDVTRFLNARGVSAFVLKYRVAPYRYPAALRDVLRAVRFVRANAAELGIDPARIGVFGSSAGGHLAASAATLFDSPEGKTGAALDAVSARPDFVALLYPVVTMFDPHAHAGSRDALLGPKPSKDLVRKTSLELRVTKQTPPVFLVHTSEDRSVPVENSLAFYAALRGAGVPAELHVYEKGPHGFGLRPDLGTTSEWPLRFAEWLEAQGFASRH
jgi:acetyl esterase/lipase